MMVPAAASKCASKSVLVIALVLALAVGAIAEPMEVIGDIENSVPVVGEPKVTSSLLDSEGRILIEKVNGASIFAQATVVDNNGFATLASATYEIKSKASGSVIKTGQMALVLDSTDPYQISGIAQADITLPATTPEGTYILIVTVSDEEGPVSSSTEIELSTMSKFTITPLAISKASAGNTVTTSFFIRMNYGVAGETVMVKSTSIGDLTVSKEGFADDVIPASNIVVRIPEGLYVAGDSMEVIVELSIPLGTHGGTMRGTGNIVLQTFE